MLPTMEEHGCPSEFHMKTVDQEGLVQAEKCSKCGYTLTHGSTDAPVTDAPDFRRRIRRGKG